MAINIYIGKENLPLNKPFIYDVEASILAVRMSGTDFQRRIIKEVEKGEYVNDKFFQDRFGGLLYYTELSTGVKAMLEVEAFPDSVINCAEVGNNALQYFSLLNQGSLYFESRNTGINWMRDIPVCVNGRMFSHISLLNDFLR